MRKHTPSRLEHPPAPRRARWAIGLLSGALALSLVLLAVLGVFYLTQLRRNQFSKNVVFSQNYSLRSALLGQGDDFADWPEGNILSADPFLVQDRLFQTLPALAQWKADQGQEQQLLDALYPPQAEGRETGFSAQGEQTVLPVYDLLLSLARLDGPQAVSAGLDEAAALLAQWYALPQDSGYTPRNLSGASLEELAVYLCLDLPVAI